MKDKNSDLTRLEKALGYTFNDKALLNTALTHRSKSKNNNERLEFLGDALLETILSDVLYHNRPGANEGDLTRMRASLVRGQTLAEIATTLNLKNYMQVGSGELRTGGYQRESIIADAFEAIIAAVYLDSGDFIKTSSVVKALFKPLIENLPAIDELKDPKTRLQEYLQSRNLQPPIYTELSATGPDHNRVFFVRCQADNYQVDAKGSSKKKAEQAAAEQILSQLNII